MSFDVSAGTGADAYSAQILHPEDPGDGDTLSRLRSDPAVDVVDRSDTFTAALRELRPAPDSDLLAEPMRWAYFPWRRAVVAIPGPRAFRRLRLDRNRNLITEAEQDRLATLRIGVIGLSVGHAIAHTLAAEGLCGRLLLADFDALELSNLNRVAATVFDLGLNKATVAARRVAELDPYLAVQVVQQGLTLTTIDQFLSGVDVVVEECDSLNIKAAVRLAARSRRIPVLMATSDRGMLDVERYDLEPDRPILHGLLDTGDVAALAGLSGSDKVPHVLRMLNPAQLSSRAAASLVELDRTLSAWPQMAGEIELGAACVARAIRRIGLGEPLASGRIRVDVDQALDGIRTPALPPPAPDVVPSEHPDIAVTVVDAVADAAMRAPSAANAQPWRIETGERMVTISIDPAYSSAVDLGFRASAVALGAAVFNARVAAAQHNVLGPVKYTSDDECPLRAVIRLDDGQDPALARLYQPMLERETNRRLGTPGCIEAETIGVLESAARREGARLRVITKAAEIGAFAAILAATDRARYLTPHLHKEMLAEVRWPGDPSPDTGIDVRGLELSLRDLAKLDILKRPDVMSHLARWEAGAALGDAARDGVRTSSGLAVITIIGDNLVDYARGGSAAEAVWVAATGCGLAVHPVTPLFLYAIGEHELYELSAPFATTLAELRDEFRDLCGIAADESAALVMKLVHAPRASVRSRRRSRNCGHPD